jgi:NDP-sugar pyrophosphorylase family protein
MLLCAGLGTRLGALSDERPKPMLPVCDVPIVRFGIAQLVAHGIHDIVINLHHRGDVFERVLGDGHRFGARIRYSHEPEILGTGGGLKHALPLLDPDGRDEPFVSMNGKLIFDVDLTALLAAHAAALAAEPALLGMMVVRRVPDALAWGAVDVQGGRVRDVLGKGEHMFCGVHVTRPSVVARLPDGEACMIRQGYLPWMHAGGAVAAYEHQHGYFAEHSTPARYVASNWAMLDGAPLSFPPEDLRDIDQAADIAASATIRPPVRIAAGASILDGATVGPYAVIGSCAMVAAGVTVERSVVWPDTHVRADVRDAIVTPAAVVPVTPD